jgi:hypothetical protein
MRHFLNMLKAILWSMTRPGYTQGDVDAARCELCKVGKIARSLYRNGRNLAVCEECWEKEQKRGNA